MQIIYLLLAVLAFIGVISFQNDNQNANAAVSGETQAISGSMEVYRANVIHYAETNPTAVGTIPDGALNLPSWFSKINGISNYVVNGKAYVWFAPSTPVIGSALASQLLTDTSNLINVGVKRAGVLVNPAAGITSIPVPSAVPDGSVVIADG